MFFYFTNRKLKEKEKKHNTRAYARVWH